MKSKPLPYCRATNGTHALREMERFLTAIGASAFGHMEDSDTGEVTVSFTWGERAVSIRASAVGYAAISLKRNPWTARMRVSRIEHERRALQKAQIAIYSLLRDWLKAQCTAIGIGLLSFDAAFLGHVMLPSGDTVPEFIEREKVLSLPASTPALSGV